MRQIVAAVMPKPLAPVELREFSEPDLPVGSALLATVYSEVCGTDVHLWHGRLQGVPYPIIPGHVSIGTLSRVNGPFNAIDGTALAEGDRVVFFDVHRTCGVCRACTVARTPTRCAQRRVYGITDSANEGLFGGWSEAVYLEPGVAVLRLPSNVSSEAYIGGGCGLLTAVHIIERADISLGTSAVVQGTGAVGLCVIALARLAGASFIAAIGAPSDRLALARRMGADVTFDLDESDAAERRMMIHAATDGVGPDVVIEAAGSPRAVEEGLELVRDGGIYVIAGHYTNVGESRINAHEHINRKHLDIRGCWGSEVRHFARAVRVLGRHADEFPWEAIGTRVYALDDLNTALADAEAMKVTKALVRPAWRTSSSPSPVEAAR